MFSSLSGLGLLAPMGYSKFNCAIQVELRAKPRVEILLPDRFGDCAHRLFVN